MNPPAYDWQGNMGNYGQPAAGFGNGLGSSPFGSWFQPQQMQTAQMPMAAAAPVMPTGTDLSNLSMGSFAPSGMDTQYASGTFDAPQTAAPAGGSGGGMGAWFGNGQNLGALAQGFGALTSAWLGYQNLRVAKDQLGFQKDAFNKNYKSQTQSYNTSLEDRIRGRTADYAGKEQDVQSYLDKNKLGG